MTLEEKLKMSKETQRIVEEGRNTSQKQKLLSNDTITGSPEYLEQVVYGAPTSNGSYNARDEYKRIQERAKQAITSTDSKLPKAIRDSIEANPLYMETADPKMEAFTEKLARIMPGIQKSFEVQKKLNETKSDSGGITAQEQGKTTTIDYEIIKVIIEESVKKEMAKFFSDKDDGGHLRAVKVSENDNFYFVDGNNNLYSCSIKYIGKNKRKKNSK